MPDWSYSGTSGSSGWVSTSYTSEAMQQMWDEFQLECTRITTQKMRDAKEECHQEQLRQEEMRKYPLFFWRETCKEEGIV